jgi:type IV pilus assembly protein PilE
MVVLVIVGILTLIALPNLQSFFGRAYAVEAQTQLKHIYKLQSTHRQVHFKYTDDLAIIGFDSPKTINENGNAKYAYEIANAGDNNFIARATAVADFDGDGPFNVWEIDHEGNLQQVTPD